MNINCLDSILPNIAGEAALAHLGVLLIEHPEALGSRALDDLDSVLAGGCAVPAWSRSGVPIPTRSIVVVSVDAPSSAPLSDGAARRFANFFDMIATIDLVAPDVRARLAAGESSATIAARVLLVRRRAHRRNSAPPPTVDPCQAGEPDGFSARTLISDAAIHLGLGARDIAGVGRVARTIADLAGSARIEPRHAAEALWLRPRRACLPRAA